MHKRVITSFGFYKCKAAFVGAFALVAIAAYLAYNSLSRPLPPYGAPRSHLILWVQNEQKLKELHPAFRLKVRAVIKDLKTRKLRPRIATAWRSPQSQADAVAAGKSKVQFGFHNITGPNGQKRAWACDIVDDNNARVTNPKFFFPLAKIAESHGLITGIRWGLSESDIRLVELSIEKEDWAGTTTMRTGWDPAHLQPIGITAEQAQKDLIKGAFVKPRDNSK